MGQAGADVGMPAQACTIATALKAQGYATGQFGKNHLGDLNKFLPTLHGFDEFFGYLYHLDAMSDPFWYSFPSDPAFFHTYGPRNLVHCWATDTDDETVMPRWGKVGKQRIEDEGPLRPFKNMEGRQHWQAGPPGSKYDMETFDEVLVENTNRFMDDAKKSGKPFFIWHNTTRMHVFTFLSPKYQETMNYQTNYGLEEAGMKQMDDSIGAIMKHLDDIGEADNTLVVFSTDNGAEVFTWPDGGMTPFKATKGTVMEGGFRVPCIARWPGKIKPGTVQNGTLFRSRLVPHHARRRRQSEHHRRTPQRREARRSDLQEPPRRLQPVGPAARAKGRPSVKNSSILAARIWVPSGSAISSTSSTSNPKAGPGPKSRRTCPPSSTSVRIPSNGRRRPVSRA